MLTIEYKCVILFLPLISGSKNQRETKKMAQLTKNQKSAVVTDSISQEQLTKLSHIIAEESGCEDYTLERIEEHNTARKLPEKTQIKKLIWLATHKFIYLAYALAIVISGLVFTLIVGIATGFVGTVYLFGTIIGAFVGFVLGSYIFPLHVNIKNCDRCETLLARRELYRKKIDSEKDVEKVNVYNNRSQKFANEAHLVETTLYAVIYECKSCGTRALEVIREKNIVA